MAIKFILVLFVISLQAFAETKESTWQHFQDLGDKLLQTSEVNDDVTKMHEEFKGDDKQLTEMEYKENEAEILSSKVDRHLKDLEEKNWKKNFEVSLTYLSFQREADIKNPTLSKKLISTSNVLCVGGGYGISRKNVRYSIEGCAFYGNSNVGSQNNAVTYEEDTIPTYGLKAAPAAGIFVSNIKSEVGFKLPILYVHQKFSTPPGGYSIKKGSDIQALASFYYRFPIDNWFLQMEFGKFLSQDTTLWGLGAGLRF
jgi:hypothetical protein